MRWTYTAFPNGSRGAEITPLRGARISEQAPLLPLSALADLLQSGQRVKTVTGIERDPRDRPARLSFSRASLLVPSWCKRLTKARCWINRARSSICASASSDDSDGKMWLEKHTPSEKRVCDAKDIFFLVRLNPKMPLATCPRVHL